MLLSVDEQNGDMDCSQMLLAILDEIDLISNVGVDEIITVLVLS